MGCGKEGGELSLSVPVTCLWPPQIVIVLQRGLAVQDKGQLASVRWAALALVLPSLALMSFSTFGAVSPWADGPHQ